MLSSYLMLSTPRIVAGNTSLAHTDADFMLVADASSGIMPLAMVAAVSVGQCLSVGTVSGIVSVTTSPALNFSAPVAIAFINRKRATDASYRLPLDVTLSGPYSASVLRPAGISCAGGVGL
jgi:hypothetical protein